jgi:hypothetical protein
MVWGLVKHSDKFNVTNYRFRTHTGIHIKQNFKYTY